MIQPMYKKGKWLAWTGFVVSIISFVVTYVFAISYGSRAVIVISEVVYYICVAIIVWGIVLMLKAKKRSMWWMLFLLPAVFGEGVIFTPILLIIASLLGDKSVAAASAASPASTISGSSH